MTYVSEAGSSPDDGCFLCAAAVEGGSDEGLVVERSASTFTLLNRYPYSSGHLMVVPIRHAPDILELTADEGAALLAGVQQAVRALIGALHPGGFNIGLNHGEVAGASVEHVHMHVVPRWGGDTNFMPVLGDVKVLPEHLEATAARLREAYTQV